jgi:Component of IIS longevity pathway SMK-1
LFRFEKSCSSFSQLFCLVQVDLALSFQDNAGCLDIWRQITQVQSRAADWFRSHGLLSKSNCPSAAAQTSPETMPSVTDMAQAVAAAHHASLQRQQQHAMWVNVASEAAQNHFQHSMEDDDDPAEFREQDAEAVAVSMAAAAAAAYGGCGGTELPRPPTLQNLEEIADLIAAAQALPQRESLAMFISKNDCSYLKDLLHLFDPAEARQDYGALATLAACVKTILLLNEPSVIDLIVNDEAIYEKVCSTLEYDPDLRDKANHRWFLKERAKFRTVVLMEVSCELYLSTHRGSPHSLFSRTRSSSAPFIGHLE